MVLPMPLVLAGVSHFIVSLPTRPFALLYVLDYYYGKPWMNYGYPMGYGYTYPGLGYGALGFGGLGFPGLTYAGLGYGAGYGLGYGIGSYGGMGGYGGLNGYGGMGMGMGSAMGSSMGSAMGSGMGLGMGLGMKKDGIDGVEVGGDYYKRMAHDTDTQMAASGTKKQTKHALFPPHTIGANFVNHKVDR